MLTKKPLSLRAVKEVGVFKKQGARGRVPFLLFSALLRFCHTHRIRVVVTRGGFTSYGPPGHAEKGAVDIRLPSRDGYSIEMDAKLLAFLNSLPAVRAILVNTGTAPHIHVEVGFVPVS